MKGLQGLIVGRAELGAVIRYLSGRFDVVSRPSVRAAPFHWELACHQEFGGPLRLLVLGGINHDRWFYDVIAVRRSHEHE